MSNQARQPAGTPSGGQFAANGRAEVDLTLEEMFHAGEDPAFDPDDPFHADLHEGADLAAPVHGVYPVGYNAKRSGGASVTEAA